MLAGVLALWLSYGQLGAPYITNDGYQYLDAASNLASGRCFCTGVALFDEQVAYGRIPVPFTHFAPGYPLLIAGISRAGIRAETAGYLLSALGYLAVLWLIQDLGLNLGARPWVVVAFSLLWIAHATALYYAALVGTETLFAAALVGMADLIVRDVRSNSSRPTLMAAIGAVAGLSYWIRYPGLFLVAAAGIYLIVRAWRVPGAWRGTFAGLLASAILVGSVQIRNAILSGSLQGGFKTAGGRLSLVPVFSGTIRALSHLVTGDRIPLHVDVWIAILSLSSAALLFLVLQAWRRGPIETAATKAAFGWTIFIGVVYICGVLAAALTTIAADLPRYYFPVYPLALGCAAAACSRLAGKLGAAMIAMFIASVVAVEGRNLFVPPASPDWILTRTFLDEPVETGATLLDWLRNHTSESAPILAVEGQALHYILQRPVIAVISAEFTARRPDEEGFRALMRQQRARYLLILPGAPEARIPEELSYGFLRSLASGETPSWLKLAARTKDAAVYECPDCDARS